MGHLPMRLQRWCGRAALASVVILVGLEGLAMPQAAAATTVAIGSQFLGTTAAACPGSFMNSRCSVSSWRWVLRQTKRSCCATASISRCSGQWRAMRPALRSA